MDDLKLRKITLGVRASKSLNESEIFLLQELKVSHDAVLSAFRSGADQRTIDRLLGEYSAIEKLLVKLGKQVVEGNRLTKEMLDNDSRTRHSSTT